MFWIIQVENREGGKYQHGSLESAKLEAKRLAGMPENQGRRVYLLQHIATVEVSPPFIWSDPNGNPMREPDEIPF